MVTAEAAYCALGAANTRVHCLPTTLGIDHRIINGRVYIGGNAVTDPAEIARRTTEFQKRAFYYYANWETLYAQWKREDADADRGRAGAAEARACRSSSRWSTCTPAAASPRTTSCSVTYQKTLEGLLPDVAPPLRVPAARLRRVPDASSASARRPSRRSPTRRSRGWWRASKPRSSGPTRSCGASRAAPSSWTSMRTSRKARSADAILRVAAQRGRAGPCAGSRSCKTSRDPWFNINVGDGFYHYHRGWNDDLSMPFAALPEYTRRVRAGESLLRHVGKLQSERVQLIADYRELLATDEERAAYDQMIGARAPRVPLRRGTQVLLRALVHQPVLQQDPRVRRAAVRGRASSRSRKTCSS